MLTLWRLTKFSEVPNNYDELLASVVKKYPTVFKPAAFIPEPPKVIEDASR